MHIADQPGPVGLTEVCAEKSYPAVSVAESGYDRDDHARREAEYVESKHFSAGPACDEQLDREGQDGAGDTEAEYTCGIADHVHNALLRRVGGAHIGLPRGIRPAA